MRTLTSLFSCWQVHCTTLSALLMASALHIAPCSSNGIGSMQVSLEIHHVTGAGTGKTTTLVARILHMVVDKVGSRRSHAPCLGQLQNSPCMPALMHCAFFFCM